MFLRSDDKITPFGCIFFVLWLTFFFSFSSLLYIYSSSPVVPFDDKPGLRISVLLAKREGVCGSFSLSFFLSFAAFEKSKSF